MATVSPLKLYTDAFRGLNNWYALLMYGFLGTMTSFIITYQSFDTLRDRFQASYYDYQDTFDFIIVGGGSAGAVVANRLSEQFKVLLLDAGGDPNPITMIPSLAFIVLNRPHVDWQFFTVPQKNACLAMNNQACAWPRGKALGGSSNLNFLIYMRGNPMDFDNWANITGDRRWSYDGVLPFFKKSEDYIGEWDTEKYHSKGGYLKVSEPPYKGLAEDFINAGIERGYKRLDLNAPFSEGFSPIYYTQYRGRRQGTFTAFIEPIKERKNLYIYRYAHVNKVLLDENNQAYGVEYDRHGDRKIAYATKEVILSAGSLLSPKILMLSGIGPKKHLESLGIRVRLDLPVGKNLQDHISSFVGPFTIQKPLSMLLDRDINPASVQDYVDRGLGPVTSTGIQASSFFVSSKAREAGETKWPDIQFLLLGTGIYNRADVDFTRSFNVKPGILTKFLKPLMGNDGLTIINMLSRPVGRGEILLASKDPSVPPLFDPKYLQDPEDIRVLVEGSKKAVDLIENTITFQSMGGKLSPIPFPPCENVTFRSDEYWACFAQQYTLTIYHPVGTCSMGKKNSKHAVVDSELRVLGTKRLRVIDASIMPKITSGNTNAPSIMIGEVGANFIKMSWHNKK